MKVIFRVATMTDLNGDGKLQSFKAGSEYDLPKGDAVSLIKAGHARAAKGSDAENATVKRA